MPETTGTRSMRWYDEQAPDGYTDEEIADQLREVEAMREIGDELRAERERKNAG